MVLQNNISLPFHSPLNLIILIHCQMYTYNMSAYLFLSFIFLFISFLGFLV
jgi:hypothetical protein